MKNYQGANGHSTSSNGAHASVHTVNGAHQQQHHDAHTTQNQPLDKDAKQVRKVTLQIESDLMEYGRQEAFKTGALEPDEQVLRVAQEHAGATARAAYREAYDPHMHPHDKLSEEEYKKLQRDRDHAELAEQHALATVANHDEKVAQAPIATPPKPPSPILLVAAIVAIMVSIAPTLHDFVFVTGDPIMEWTLSMVCGLFLGLLVTLMILGDLDSDGQRSAYNWIGLSAGLFMCVALCAIRLKEATATGDYIFAFGLSGLEAAIVMALEGVAMSRRAAHGNYVTNQATLKKAVDLRDAAVAHLQRVHLKLDETNSKIREHINYVEDRSTRHLHIDEIEAAAIQAVTTGYYSGIGENQRHVYRVKEG